MASVQQQCDDAGERDSTPRMTRFLSTDQPEHKESRVPATTEPAAIWTIVVAMGIAISVVGWTDLALLWVPLHVSGPEWAFGTISGHFDGMPLGTLGITILAVGAYGKGWHRTTKVLAVLVAVITVALLAISLRYLLDVPLVLRGTAPEMSHIVKKAVFKTGVFAVTYICFYSWLAWFLWLKTMVHKA